MGNLGTIKRKRMMEKISNTTDEIDLKYTVNDSIYPTKEEISVEGQNIKAKGLIGFKRKNSGEKKNVNLVGAPLKEPLKDEDKKSFPHKISFKDNPTIERSIHDKVKSNRSMENNVACDIKQEISKHSEVSKIIYIEEKTQRKSNLQNEVSDLESNPGKYRLDILKDEYPLVNDEMNILNIDKCEVLDVVEATKQGKTVCSIDKPGGNFFKSDKAYEEKSDD